MVMASQNSMISAQVNSEVFANDVFSPPSQKNLHTFCVKVFGTDQVRSLTDSLSG